MKKNGMVIIMSKFEYLDLSDIMKKEAMEKVDNIDNIDKQKKGCFEKLKEYFRCNKTKAIQCNILLIMIIITILVLALLYISKSNQESYKYFTLFFITAIYIIVLIFFRDSFISKIIFMYKERMMELYYEEFPPKEKKIPISDNGKIIGILEGFLFSAGVFIQSVTFIGIILAIRSYVVVSSHPNKEESEFYIMGVMGSLFSSLTITGIYILVVNAFLKINILEQLSQFIPKLSQI